MATIYLIAQRKRWHHELPEGWTETHWERFDFVECGIFTKPDEDLSDVDRELIDLHSDIPDGWIHPISHDEREEQRAAMARSN